VDVPVVEGRVLEQLPVLVAVAPRIDQTRRLEDEVPLRLAVREPVGHPARTTM
jgi:hypothetical protein